MQKSILLFLFACITSVVMAQPAHRHQLSVSVGTFKQPADRMFNHFKEDVARHWGYNLHDFESPFFEMKQHLSWSVTYQYRLSERWDVGVTGLWASQTNTKKHIETEYVPISFILPIPIFHTLVKSTYSSRLWAVMPTVSYRWGELANGLVRFYSKAGVGVGSTRFHFEPEIDQEQTPLPYTERRTRCAYQLTPVGISCGLPGFRVFFEGGYGYQGILNAGLTVAL